MVEIIKANENDIEDLMSIRLEMLRGVNGMSESEDFSQTLVDSSRDYFLHGEQTTLLAKDGERVIGCASISYIWIMPTFSHPTGKRAHLMNVYTASSYRRQGLARRMVKMLIKEARERGCTEISLDATEEGRPLYKALGFVENSEGMCLALSVLSSLREPPLLHSQQARRQQQQVRQQLYRPQ